ncbi:2-aminoethylphosphonate--pyruvate transaminase [Viridibacillus sp. YIM B01967]|uniref:2-aminoethylphosphonate--pyruvate transaminase n=1 Tax=Viridibacillus soli TaxID=2798301 RepID=A0ABS1H614_9BACL|nr:2-aminoethylphosphonate--pyruvate transaminase [Viridibacillus soli]MBK3494845.1 2-aminoethylphosphonate--pyruvate transaminase [Viridibacillus soli]
MVKTAVILAAGLGSRLRPYTETRPKGFLQVYEHTSSLIEMSIQALLENGIEKIYIGTGYKNNYYDNLAQNYDEVICVHNPQYASTGSLATLLSIYPFIKDDDILLLESDLLYDSNGIRELIFHKEYNVILASNPTNSNDEVFIEVTEKYQLVQLSKNLNKLRKSYGELVGISKISSSLLHDIAQYAQRTPNVSSLDYEEALVALKSSAIFVHKITNYTWCEIDNEEHLDFARKNIFPRLQLLNTPIKRNILLNPGPATTSNSVKYAQIQSDICPREQDFGEIMRFITEQLTGIVGDQNEHTTTLFPGSGTAAVEAILTSVFGENDHLLIVHNGAYGKRMKEICDTYNINYTMYNSAYISPLDYEDLEQFITNQQSITHLAIVHNETTTGLLNNLDTVGTLCRKHSLVFIVDAMSSYAAIPIDMKKQNISFLAASSNKNIQGMAGVGFVIAENNHLNALANVKAKSYYLDLFSQYIYFKKTNQVRFTPPVQTMYALKQAIIEVNLETIENRYQRYTASWEVLIEGLKQLGLKWIIPLEHQSKIITAIYEPEHPNYDFDTMHDTLLNKGFTIYPGKVGNLNTFRIANIGEINKNDIEHFINALHDYFRKAKIS